MYRDWSLLDEIDQELQKAASRWGVELPEWPEKPPDEHQAAMKEYRGAVTDVAIRRKEVVEQISRLENPLPPSWIELAERMWEDAWLETFIRSQIACRAARDETIREAIVQCVKVRLYCVILSNAGKWYHEGNHDQNWRGFVIRQVPQLTRRCAGEMNPPDREQPRGDGGPGGGADGGGPLDYLGQSRELPPEIQAEFHEMLEIVESELTEAERRLREVLYFEARRSEADIAKELGVTPLQLKNLKRRLREKLLRILGAIPQPKVPRGTRTPSDPETSE